MELNINETRSINAFALKELARIIQISEEDMDNHIIRVRDRMIASGDVRISEVIPEMVEDCNMDDVMVGALLAIFAVDYYMGQYMKDDIDDNR